MPPFAVLLHFSGAADILSIKSMICAGRYCICPVFTIKLNVPPPESLSCHAPQPPSPADVPAARSLSPHTGPVPSATGKRIPEASVPKTCRETRRSSCRKSSKETRECLKGDLGCKTVSTANVPTSMFGSINADLVVCHNDKAPQPVLDIL